MRKIAKSVRMITRLIYYSLNVYNTMNVMCFDKMHSFLLSKIGSKKRNLYSRNNSSLDSLSTMADLTLKAHFY